MDAICTLGFSEITFFHAWTVKDQSCLQDRRSMSGRLMEEPGHRHRSPVRQTLDGAFIRGVGLLDRAGRRHVDHQLAGAVDKVDPGEDPGNAGVAVSVRIRLRLVRDGADPGGIDWQPGDLRLGFRFAPAAADGPKGHDRE